MTIRAVFWDSDNTLVDSARLHWRKHAETLALFGINLDEATHGNRIYTNNGRQNWEWLSAELGLEVDADDYLAMIDGWYAEHIHEIPLRAGVADALKMIGARGLPQAVVSNGRTNSVMSALDARGITPIMRFILCKEDYDGRKPEPTPYLTALSRMILEVGAEITPEECLVIEDDPLGVEAGQRAGMRVIHRKRNAEQKNAPFAAAHVYEADEFLETLAGFLA